MFWEGFSIQLKSIKYAKLKACLLNSCSLLMCLHFQVLTSNVHFFTIVCVSDYYWGKYNEDTSNEC